MQDKLQSIENARSEKERRGCERLRVTPLVYIDIGGLNGGIVTSLSEKGLAFTAAVNLSGSATGDGPLRIGMLFPGIPEAIEASGEIVWTSSSGKEARLRFVELEETAREQIRAWIATQAATNGLGPGPPRLADIRLPKSPAVKARRSRFSFSDVASSRVDAEGETAVEDSPGIGGELGLLPSLQTGATTFVNETEAVASTFESPAFTDEQIGKTPSTGNAQESQATSGQDLKRSPSLSIPERRRHPRRQILLFTYAVLGEDNGGLAFNLGEDGLALTAAAALQEHHFGKIRLRFPDSEDWIETSGRLAWKSDSGKEAGIEFAGLPEDARARIREWVLQGELAGDHGSKEDEARTSQSPVQELPSFMEPQDFFAEPIETLASFEEQPFEDRPFEERHFDEPAKTLARSSSALFETGIRGIFERAPARTRIAEIKPPRLANDSARLRTRIAGKALGIAAGVVLAAAGWMFLQRSSLDEANGIIVRNRPHTQPSQEPIQKPEAAKTGIGTRATTADPPVQPTTTSQTNAAKPSGQQQIEIESRAANTSKEPVGSRNAAPGNALKEKRRSEESAAQRAPARVSTRRSSDKAQRLLSSQSERERKGQRIAASAPARASESTSGDNKAVETRSTEGQPAENKPVLIAQAVSVQNNDLHAAPLSLNSNAPQPAAAPTVEMNKANAVASPKPPETPLAQTPVVTVNFDPYPSIRMQKAEKSKKSQQGKSLQMGRLVTRVDPLYPGEAKQQGVEGTVTVHAIFSREGTVQSMTPVSGPPQLVPATMNAIRQWRYSQTILGGQAMETEEDIAVQFRLTNSASKN